MMPRLIRRRADPLGVGPSVLAALLALGLSVPVPSAAQEAGPGERAGPTGWIGVGLRPVLSCQWTSAGAGERDPDARACDRTVLCETVVVDGPADQAGVRPGDALLEIDGRSVLADDGSLDLPPYGPGETITLTLRRDGDRRQVQIVPEERPDRPTVRPVKVLRRGVSVTPSPPQAPETATPEPRSWVVRMAPVASAPNPPAVAVRSGQGGHFVVQAPSGGALDSIVAAARAGTLEGWPGAEAFVTSRSRKAYDSALAEIRPVLDSLRVVQREQLREMVEASREARREAIEQEERQRARIREQQIRELREQQREVEEQAEQVREAMERRITEAMRARELSAAPRIVRLAGAEFLTLSPELAESFDNVDGGLLVTRVVEGFPADELGLQEGDVVVEAGGESVSTAGDFRRALMQLAHDGSLEVVWVRRGSRASGTLRK